MPISVVISQGQSANPIKRKLEEELVAALLFERGVEVTVVPHLYDLKVEGTGMLCLQSLPGDLIVLSWLYPRAAFWTLDRNGIRGRLGATLLVSDENEEEPEEPKENDPALDASRSVPNRAIYCLDLRAANTVQPFVDEVKRIVAEASIKTVDLVGLTLPVAPLPSPVVT
ncbi:MAG TPA: ferredoxin family protein, partial [Pirellulales bacterium]|nr:ferredoxin family protein [Pirellulales bacterium]